MKLNYKRTLLVGFAFLSISAFWQMYDSIIPLILRNTFEIGEAATGRVMAIDNILALFMLPLFGHLSDNTHTKLGKRTPYIILGTAAAVCFMLLLPVFDRTKNLLGFALCLGVTLFSMATYRSPAVSLMPDVTPKPLRSKGNAVINLMGALGAVISLGLIAFLVPKEGKPDYFPIFAIVAAIMVAAVVILVLTIRENKLVAEMEATGGYESTEEELNEELSKGKKMPKDILKSLIFMLIALFFNSNATDSINTYFTSFATTELGFSSADASLVITLFAAASVIGALPAGKLGQKFGRKKTIMSGWIGVLVLFLTYALTKWDPLLYIAIVCGGILIAFVTINTLPLVLEIGGLDRVGTFTGYYYTATFSASIVGPVLVGGMFDLTKLMTPDGQVNYWSLFIYCPICFALALLCMSQVKHGETQTISKETIDKIKEENED